MSITCPTLLSQRLTQPSTRFGWSKANPPKNYRITLTRDDVNMVTLTPKPHVITHIAQKLLRNGNMDRPGFAVIPRTKHIVGTKERAQTFQTNLMRALKEQLSLYEPKALSVPRYSAKPPAEADYDDAVLDIASFYFRGDGDYSVKQFHSDLYRFMYTSLLYGPNRNIVGGNPRMLDLMQMKHDLGISRMRDLLTYPAYNEPVTDNSIHDDVGDRYAELKARYRDHINTYSHQINGLNPNDMPIVIFNNRPEAGLHHGASKAQKKPGKSHLPASRPINYCAIKYFSPDAHQAVYGD